MFGVQLRDERLAGHALCSRLGRNHERRVPSSKLGELGLGAAEARQCQCERCWIALLSSKPGKAQPIPQEKRGRLFGAAVEELASIDPAGREEHDHLGNPATLPLVVHFSDPSGETPVWGVDENKT